MASVPAWPDPQERAIRKTSRQQHTEPLPGARCRKELLALARERCAPRKRRTRVIWTEDLITILRQAYENGGSCDRERLKAAKAAIHQLRPQWSDACVVQELNRLALRTPEPRPRVPLSERELEFVAEHAGSSSLKKLAIQMAKEAGVKRRSPTTLWSVIRHWDDQPSQCDDLFDVKTLADQDHLRTSLRQIRRWVSKGYLWTDHRRIRLEFVAAFVVEYGRELLTPAQLHDARVWLGDYLEEFDPETISVSQCTVAERLGVDKQRVRQWVALGWLEKRKCDKRITRLALRRFLLEREGEIDVNGLAKQHRNWVKRLLDPGPPMRTRRS